MQMREKQEQKSNEVMQDRYFASALNQQISESLQKDQIKANERKE